jgi:H+/Cl- antiporter ClcA
LGSALSALLPIPTELLAGIGFVAIFAGASKTPIACTVMGMELFGIQYGVFLAMGCIIAYFISGKKGIYTS